MICGPCASQYLISQHLSEYLFLFSSFLYTSITANTVYSLRCSLLSPGLPVPRNTGCVPRNTGCFNQPPFLQALPTSHCSVPRRTYPSKPDPFPPHRLPGLSTHPTTFMRNSLASTSLSKALFGLALVIASAVLSGPSIHLNSDSSRRSYVSRDGHDVYHETFLRGGSQLHHTVV
jgi:hypothetical protein